MEAAAFACSTLGHFLSYEPTPSAHPADDLAGWPASLRGQLLLVAAGFGASRGWLTFQSITALGIAPVVLARCWLLLHGAVVT